MNDDGVNLERHIKDSPFLWIGKPVVRRIREAFDASHQVASALCVYCALAEIASDGQSETFTTTQGHIAQKCGLSVRTVAARLKELTAAGLVEVNTPDLRAPSTYRLLTFGNGCATIGNGCRAFGNDRNQVTLPTLEQVENKTSEEILKKGGASKSRSTFSLSDDDWLSGLSKAPA